MAESIVNAENLSLKIWGNTILNSVNLTVNDGEITCLVGESGSGKSTFVSTILGLLPRGGVISQDSLIEFKGDSIFSIYQDPMNSFNPSIKVGKQMYDMAEGYGRISKFEFLSEITDIMLRLRFSEPELVLEKYPFELSGGMLQRLMIATAILVKPDLVIADEPTTALDVSIQKEIMKEFRQMNKSYGMAILVVTHDFGVVAELADQVIIMQNGRVVESGDVFKVFDHPEEDYTKRLLEASFTFEEEGGLL